MDEYCILQLQWMFSPILTSLRALQQASELDKVRKKPGVGRASLGSLSESVSIFDPEPLQELAGCSNSCWVAVIYLSTKQNGVEIQTYIAIIACLLILIHTGRAATKRTYEMICLYMSGWASLDELERHIEKLKAAKK